MGRKKKKAKNTKRKVKTIGTTKPKDKTLAKAGKPTDSAFPMPQPRPAKKGERPDWHRNHELILYHSTKYVCDHLRFPSCRIISGLTGIHEETVRRHLKDYDQERRKNKYTVNLDAVTARLVKDVIKTGDKGKAELLFKYVANWSERLSLEHSGRIDFRTARERVDESKDNFEKTRSFVKLLAIQNDRRQFISQN